MSQKITGDQCSINGQLYNLSNPVRKRYIDPFPAKINVGPDDYAKESILSNWIIKDQRGGIGIEEMDESIHPDRCWWTNLNCDYPGHMLLPRLATQLATTAVENPSAPTIVNGDFELTTGWSAAGGGGFARTDVDKRSGTYSWYDANVPTGQGITQTLTGFHGGLQYTVTAYVKCADPLNTMRVTLNDGVSTTNGTAAGGTDFTAITCAKTISLLSTTLIITIENVGDKNTGVYIDDCSIAVTSTASNITPRYFANFNSNLYCASGTDLYKLNSGRTAWTQIGAGFGASILGLIPGVNSSLYIYVGDTEHYYYMSTSELFVHTDVTGFYYGCQFDDKLFKLTSAGVCTYTATPNAASPSWTGIGDITDIASQIETMFVARDADGAPALYCATNSTLKVLSVPSTGINDAIWIDTEVKLPSHPNGGKGACYFNNAIYLSYGLGIKKYTVGSTGGLSEAGLDRDDGLPYEYNGEIVKLYADAGMDVMFALVDSSQVTGTGYSGLYALTTNGQKRCWWIDGTADEAMYDVIVSSASSSYAVYWAVGSSVYYIDIPRGNQNPLKYITNTEYENYATGNDSSVYIYSTLYKAQTFTPSVSHTITKVRLKLFRRGSAGTVTVGIYATSSSHPTGSALCSGSLDSDEVTTSGTGEWYDISLGGGTSLTLSTKYAIVVSATGTGIPNSLSWSADGTSPSYTGGSLETSSDSGSTWTTNTGYDCMFEEWGYSSTYYYASSGNYFSSWYDGNSSAWRKLIKRLRAYSKNLSSTETITVYYRTNHSFTDLSSGWTTLVTLDSTSENGEVLTSFASGLGINVASIQFKIAFARGSTTTITPDLQGIALSYRLSTKGYWVWSLPVIIDGKHGRSLKQQQEDIESAASSETDVPLILRRDDADEPHYVKLNLPLAWNKTGTDYNGAYTLEAIET